MDIEKAINKTKKTLKTHGCSFKEYMRDCGRRDDIDLCDVVSTKTDGDGVVVGWNNSCNYNVFLFKKQSICNVHPDSVELVNKHLNRTCKTCYWLCDETCVNDESPLCADFPPSGYGCIHHQERNKQWK